MSHGIERQQRCRRHPALRRIGDGAQHQERQAGRERGPRHDMALEIGRDGAKHMERPLLLGRADDGIGPDQIAGRRIDAGPRQRRRHRPMPGGIDGKTPAGHVAHRQRQQQAARDERGIEAAADAEADEAARALGDKLRDGR